MSFLTFSKASISRISSYLDLYFVRSKLRGQDDTLLLENVSVFNLY